MHRILVLWATPRSTSTAFEWMMRMRGDLNCFHEPFGQPWYFGEQPMWPRATVNSRREKGLTMDKVWEELKNAARESPVFSKDFPHYVKHLWSKEFLDHFNHSFLIRDPAKVVTSMYKNWPDFLLEEIAFPEQRELFDRLSDQYGSPPPVIDSDDLLENPQAIVEAYCNAVGIPYIEEALSWKPGNREEVSWYDSGSWHGNLRNSDGLKPQPRKTIDISDAPDRVKEIYDICFPHYQYLHHHRLAI